MTGDNCNKIILDYLPILLYEEYHFSTPDLVSILFITITVNRSNLTGGRGFCIVGCMLDISQLSCEGKVRPTELAGTIFK